MNKQYVVFCIGRRFGRGFDSGPSREGSGPPFWLHFGALGRSFPHLGPPWAPLGQFWGAPARTLRCRCGFNGFEGSRGPLNGGRAAEARPVGRDLPNLMNVGFHTALAALFGRARGRIYDAFGDNRPRALT